MGTLILFTRWPEPGRTKTRLIPALGEVGAAQLHANLVGQAQATAVAASSDLGMALEIHHTGPRAAMESWLGSKHTLRIQTGRDLGERMAAALSAVQAPAVLIGTDCPALTPAVIGDAFAALRDHEVVLGPAADGGYYLVGWRSPHPEIFRDIPWGTAEVLALSRARLRAAHINWREVSILHDIDRPEDLALIPRHLLPNRTAIGQGDN